ncbi:MAG: GGDEF domain-containing protein [Lachnospiraceae bacterium]|nr:GGDEF domain-containing protein [Lachnospiraceae bacterium]
MKKNLHSFKVLKVIELTVFAVVEAIFLVILFANKNISSSIFVDLSLFRLCAVMYITILLCLGFLIYDFFKLRELKIQAHELESIAYLDRKTGMPNRESISRIFDNYARPGSMKGVACVVTKIDNIREINDIKGKDGGDLVIRDFSRLFENTGKDYGFVGRNGGNEYITIIENCDRSKVNTYLDLLNRNLAQYNKGNEETPITIRTEYLLHDDYPTEDFGELISAVYRKFD